MLGIFSKNSAFALISTVVVIVALILMPQQTSFISGICVATGGFVSTIIVVLTIRHFAKNDVKTLENATRIVYENMDFIVVVTDETGQVKYANARGVREFGSYERKTIDAYIGDVFPDAVPFLPRLAKFSDDNQASNEQTIDGPSRLRIRTFLTAYGRRQWIFRRLEATSSVDMVFMEHKLPMFKCNALGEIVWVNHALMQKTKFMPIKMEQLFSCAEQKNRPLRMLKTVKGLQTVQLVTVEEQKNTTTMLLLSQQKAIKEKTNWSSLDDLPVAILRLDQMGKVVGSNNLARLLLNVDTTSEKNFAELVEGLGRSIGDWIKDHISGRTVPKPEIVLSRNSTSDKYIQVTLDTVQDRGEVFVIAVLNDATELKTLEAQFLQSQKMQAIGQLAGGVAHDFNNLLTAISGYCDLLLLRHDPADQDYADLQQIAQNANRAASLVGQLLAFSRKQNLRPEVLDVREVLADLTHLLNRLVGENIKLTQSIESDVGYTRADKRQLEQVIMNLVVNARDAMGDEGGEIKIKSELFAVKNSFVRDRATVPAGDYMVVRVSDDGSGMAKELQSKIFEPFVTTKRTGEGTGLGLSMVYGIIKQTGGFVFVDSDLGVGSEFSIYLPSCEYDPTENAVKVPVEKNNAVLETDGVVLLVEDEAPVRAFASRALRMRGYKVLEAESAEAALETLSDQDLHVDIFVSDVIMPGMDGPTWVEQALIDRPKAKVVFVSGYAKESFSAQKARIPQSTFLSKPYSLAELTECVQNELQS